MLPICRYIKRYQAQRDVCQKYFSYIFCLCNRLLLSRCRISPRQHAASFYETYVRACVRVCVCFLQLVYSGERRVYPCVSTRRKQRSLGFLPFLFVSSTFPTVARSSVIIFEAAFSQQESSPKSTLLIRRVSPVEGVYGPVMDPIIYFSQYAAFGEGVASYPPHAQGERC